jgi:hypothetical protein
MADLNPHTDNEPAKKKKPFRKILLISLILIIGGFFIYYFICGLTYSEGSRSGVLAKISKKGFVFKTYEGELYIGGFTDGTGIAGMAPRIFNFSVYRSDEAIYKQLDSLQGDRVVVYYKQVIKNFFWQGETDYFIHEVKVVK